MTSLEMRECPLFLRNEFEVAGRWGIPVIKKEPLIEGEIKMLSASVTRSNDTDEKRQCGVYFIVDDYRFTAIYRNPQKSFTKYSQYAFLLSPDFSVYADMNPWRQIESVAHSRWCGAWWQNKGLKVYPMICWSTPESYSFCFDGVVREPLNNCCFQPPFLITDCPSNSKR